MISIKKKNKIKANLFWSNILFVGLLATRIGGFHGLPALFLMLIQIIYFSKFIRNDVVLVVLLLLSFRIFIGPYTYLIRNKSEDLKVEKYVKLIHSNTKEGDLILIYPLRPDLYLLTKRFPGSYYYFFLPWIAKKPEAEGNVIEDIKTRRVKLIIFENDFSIFGKYLTSQYMKKTQEFLNNNLNYRKITTGYSLVNIYKRI